MVQVYENYIGSGAGGFGDEVISWAIDMKVDSFVVVSVFSKGAGTILVNGWELEVGDIGKVHESWLLTVAWS